MVLLMLCLSFLVGACDLLLDAEFENNPVGNFDALWHEFDRYYALFAVRGVDWDSLYAVYRPRVNEGSSDTELYDAMTGLLSHLNDRHVALYASGFPMYQSGSDRERPLFSDSHPDSMLEDFGALVETALEGYLDSVYVSAREFGYPGGFAAHGKIHQNFTSQDLGYVIVGTFLLPESGDRYFDGLVDAFRGADGVIVDVRVNGGGLSTISQALLNRFADSERPYTISRNRNGPGHTDFSEPETTVMELAEKSLRGTPLVVLTGRRTSSAAEHFALGASVLPQTTVIGDTTIGVFGSVASKVLPNGWEFTISPTLVTAMDGTSYEGTGMPPDVRVMASRADVDAGTDAVIDAAIAILEGSISPITIGR